MSGRGKQVIIIQRNLAKTFMKYTIQRTLLVLETGFLCASRTGFSTLYEMAYEG